MQVPSTKPRISCRRFAEWYRCMGTSSPIAAISSGGGPGALESTESSLLLDRMLLYRIGARCERAFGTNLAVVSISPRARNGALETLESSLVDRIGVRCERAFDTNLATASGSLAATLEGRPPTV